MVESRLARGLGRRKFASLPTGRRNRHCSRCQPDLILSERSVLRLPSSVSQTPPFQTQLVPGVRCSNEPARRIHSRHSTSNRGRSCRTAPWSDARVFDLPCQGVDPARVGSGLGRGQVLARNYGPPIRRCRRLALSGPDAGDSGPATPALRGYSLPSGVGIAAILLRSGGTRPGERVAMCSNVGREVRCMTNR